MKQHVLIDSKSKERYYSIEPLTEDSNLINSRYTFWVNMNNIAMQNVMVQRIKKYNNLIKYSCCDWGLKNKNEEP